MSGCRVFIGRLNPAAREKDVERFFKGYGRIRDIDLKRGFGFVVSAASRALCRPSPLAVLFDANAAAFKDNAVNGLTTHIIQQISIYSFLKGAGFLLVSLLWWFCRSSRTPGTQMMRSMNWMEKSFAVRGTLFHEYIRLNM